MMQMNLRRCSRGGGTKCQILTTSNPYIWREAMGGCATSSLDLFPDFYSDVANERANLADGFVNGQRVDPPSPGLIVDHFRVVLVDAVNLTIGFLIGSHTMPS